MQKYSNFYTIYKAVLIRNFGWKVCIDSFFNFIFFFFQDRAQEPDKNVEGRISFVNDFLLDIFPDSTTRQVRLKNRNNYSDIRTLVSVSIEEGTYPKTELEMEDNNFGKFVFYVGTNDYIICEYGLCIQEYRKTLWKTILGNLGE